MYQKKSKTLTMANIEEFLVNVADEVYLLMKVVLSFGLNGACRLIEVHNLTTNDISDTRMVAVINLHETKTKKDRFFAITNDCNGYGLYKKYYNMRPSGINHDSFFIYYQNLACTSQKVGIVAIPLAKSMLQF